MTVLNNSGPDINMIYIGHFAHRTPAGPRLSHGYLTTVIEADNVDSAIASMVEHLHRVQLSKALFSPGTEVSLVNCVEVRELSCNGVVMQFWSLHGSDFTEVSTSLPGADEREAASFTLRPDGGEGEEVAQPTVVLAVTTNGTLIRDVSKNARDGPDLTIS